MYHILEQYYKCIYMYIDFWLISDMTNVGFDQYGYWSNRGFILVESPESDSPEVLSKLVVLVEPAFKKNLKIVLLPRVWCNFIGRGIRPENVQSLAVHRD